MNFDSMDNADFQSQQKPTIKIMDGLEFRTREGTFSCNTRMGLKLYSCKYSLIFKNSREYGFSFYYNASPYQYLIKFK